MLSGAYAVYRVGGVEYTEEIAAMYALERMLGIVVHDVDWLNVTIVQDFGIRDVYIYGTVNQGVTVGVDR